MVSLLPRSSCLGESFGQIGWQQRKQRSDDFNERCHGAIVEKDSALKQKQFEKHQDVSSKNLDRIRYTNSCQAKEKVAMGQTKILTRLFIYNYISEKFLISLMRKKLS